MLKSILLAVVFSVNIFSCDHRDDSWCKTQDGSAGSKYGKECAL